jgi:hypothetical protein
LNRYDEAATVARLTLSLTRERSVIAHTVLAEVHLAQRHPAEAQAAANAGLADIEALLPFVQSAHYVAVLAALCRAERLLDHHAPAKRHLATLRKAARGSPSLMVWDHLQHADAQASSGDRDGALRQLDLAMEAAPHATSWFIAQSGTLVSLREEPEFSVMAERAQARWHAQAGLPPGAPESSAALETDVARVLASARILGVARPARHASMGAMLAQGLTLASTLAMLAWWMWRFFLS